MEKKFQKSLVMAVAWGFLCVGLSGCFTREICKLFKSEKPIDPSAVAVFWDGPKIGPGMNLEVTVGAVGAKHDTMSVMVDQKGEVILPLLLDHAVKCNGMTLEEFKAVLIEEYTKFYKQPQITVSFGAYDGHGVSPWGYVTVMGQVGTQGPVNMPPTMNLTVTKVLQLAGGAKPFADTTRISVFRCDKDGKQTEFKVDLREIGEDGRFDKDITLRAGDVVFVPEGWL